MPFDPSEYLKQATAAPFDPSEYLGIAKPQADTGFTGALKAGKESLLADYERLKGKTGFKDVEEAERAAQEHETKRGQIFKPTEEGWTEAPWQKFKETAGGSLPYMVAPVVAGIGAATLPLTGTAATIAGLGATGLASATQFTGSNLSRQVQEGKTLDQASLLEAGAAAIPQAALDIVGLRMIPGIRGILGKAGVQITEEQAAKLAQRSLLEKAGSVALTTGKTMGTEGLTEAGQQVFERLQAGLNITDEQARKEYYDSFIGGAVLGGTLGTAGQAFESKKVVPNPPAPTSEAPSPAGQQSFDLEGLQPTAGPTVQTPAQADPQFIVQVREQYDTLEREMDRLKQAHEEAATPQEKQAILDQAQKLDFARQELASKLESVAPRAIAPEAQGALDFNQPYPKSRLQAEPTIIGQTPVTPTPQTNLDLEFAKQRLAAGAPLTPTQELMVRQDQTAQRVAQEAAPTPEIAIPQQVGSAGVPSSYKVTDNAIDTFGVTKGATKFKQAVRGLDLMNPEDAAKFDKLVEQHERKGAKIDMDAVEAFRSEKPEPVAAREVPEQAGLPAVPYDARKGYQQAREAQFAFGQTAAPLSPRDITAQTKAEYDGRTGAEPINGPTERGVQLPSVGLQTPAGTTTPEATGVGSAVGATTPANRGAGVLPQAQPNPLAQMVQQVAPKEKKAIPQETVPRVEAKEALEDRLAKEPVSADTEALMKELGIGPAERKPTTYRVAASDTNGLTKERVEGIVKAVIAKWKNAPEIRTVQSEMQLPPAIQDQIKRDGVRRPEGVWSDADNCVFLIAGNIANAQNAVLTIAHETTGHFGIRGILGDTYLATMNRIYEGNPEVKLLADNKIDRGMDPATAVEEVLAEFAENTPNPTVMQRIVNIIRQAFAKVGFPMQGVTNGEIKQLLKDARNFVIEGKGGAKTAGTKIGNVYSADGPLFYSRLGAMVQHAPKELSKGASGAQWATWVKSNAGKFGVKKEELNWTGIEDLLATPDLADKKLTTSEVADLIKANGVQIEETMYGGAMSDEARQNYLDQYFKEYREAYRPYEETFNEAKAKLHDFANNLYEQLNTGNINLSQLLSKERYKSWMSNVDGDVNLAFVRELAGGDLPAERLYRNPSKWTVMQNEDFDTYSIYGSNLDEPVDGRRYKTADKARDALHDLYMIYKEEYEPNSMDIYDAYRQLQKTERDAAQKYMDFAERYPDPEEEPNKTTFGGWTMEKNKGGINYRELVLRLPVKKAANEIKGRPVVRQNSDGTWSIQDAEGNVLIGRILSYDTADQVRQEMADEQVQGATYEHGHWGGVTNPVVHVRFNEKTDKDGNKVLFVEELQSDWGQQYYEDNNPTFEIEKLAEIPNTPQEYAAYLNGKRYAIEASEKEAREKALEKYRKNFSPKIAKAPFVTEPKSYTALAIKRVLRYAADNGYDRVSFINGEEAHKRFPTGYKGESTEKGMMTHYDVRVPSVLKDVLRQLGASTGIQTSEINVPKSKKAGDNEFYVTLKTGGDRTIGPFDSVRDMEDAIVDTYRSLYGTPKLVEDLRDPDTQEIIARKGDRLSGVAFANVVNRGYDIKYLLSSAIEQKMPFETFSKPITATKPFLTVNLAPETAAKVKEGQALFREARTPEGKSAESLMSAFGGKPADVKHGFVQRQVNSFNKAKDTWTEAYEGNNSWVASTFGKGQNIASFDQAFNNRLYTHYMGEAKKGNMVMEDAKKALLRISTSQALHRGNLANQIIEKGDYIYDAPTNRWDSKADPINMTAFEGLIKKLATKLGVEPTRARQMMGAAYEANRLNGMYKSLDKTEQEIASLEKEMIVLRKNRKRTAADKKTIDIKQARLDKLRTLEEDLNGKVQHKTKEQVDAGMKLYNAHPEIAEGTKVWNKMRERVVKLLVETGVKTEDEAQRWLDEAAYVPFFRDMEDRKAAGPQVMARGLRESMIDRTMKGSMREVQDPIENMYQWMQWSIARAISNKQLQVMLENYKEALPNEVRSGEGGHGNTFTIYYDGTQRKFNVADPAIAQAFVGLEPIIFPGIGAAVSATNALRHIITRFPLFSAVQLFNDSYTAMFTSGLKSPFGVLKEIAKEVAKTAQGTSETRKMLIGKGILETHDYTAMNEEDAIAKRLDLDNPSSWKKLMRNLDRLSSASDNVIRQGVYNQAIKEKLSHEEAMEKAAEIVNFRRISGDPRLQFASRVIPFFNAYLQVGSVAVKTLSGRGISPAERKAAQATLLATTAKIAVLSMLYSMAIGDDEDYKKKNRTTRDRMFMIPGTGGMGIPIRTDVFALPKIIGEYTYQMMADNSVTDSKMFKQAMGRAVMGSLAPPSEGIPQIVRPVIEVATNHDFFQGREIVNATMRRLDVDRQFTKSTSEMAKGLSAIAGTVGVEWSPLNIDHFLRGYFGSAMTLTALATDDAINAVRGGPPRPAKSAGDMLASLPNMSGFISKDENTAVLSDFYEVARDVNKANATLKSMKHMPMEEQRAYREEHKKEIQLKSMVHAVEKQLVTLKQREQIIRENVKMPDTQKQAELKRITDQRDRMAKNVTKIRQRMYE